MRAEGVGVCEWEVGGGAGGVEWVVPGGVEYDLQSWWKGWVVCGGRWWVGRSGPSAMEVDGPCSSKWHLLARLLLPRLLTLLLHVTKRFGEECRPTFSLLLRPPLLALALHHVPA